MDEAVINILDDPMALSMTLKKQYEDVQYRNAALRAAEKQQLMDNEAEDEDEDDEEDAGKAEEVEVDTPQQSISTSGQGYTLEPDETT